MTGVSTLDSPSQAVAPTRYTVTLARDEADVRAAQRLRHDVFAGEMGALLSTPQPGLDVDAFDAYCDHLLVRDTLTDQVVGTYRLLPPERAAVAGRLYSEGEFDLTPLGAIRPGLVEVGRSCVHPDHRDGAVIGLIWAGIARYMVDGGHEWLAGCCSLPLADGGTLAAATWDRVRAKHLAPEEYRVRPLLPWDSDGVARPEQRTGSLPPTRPELPPLLRGYLRLGAWVCGEPAHDPDFGVADLYVLLPMSRVNSRYLRHFLSLVPA
ncbi:GNAT family N-acetyltransferase [Streptomyces acidicola]|uniref:GNAT family N-acetyltransferase n=1 Tax=Streptomyces acidicola TaxID=2596892 RepID=UPI00343A0163